MVRVSVCVTDELFETARPRDSVTVRWSEVLEVVWARVGALEIHEAAVVPKFFEFSVVGMTVVVQRKAVPDSLSSVVVLPVAHTVHAMRVGGDLGVLEPVTVSEVV